MIKLFRNSAALLVCVQLLLGGHAHAHQQKQAFSTLLFNPRTDMLEVSHRFSLHDAEHILATLFDEPSDLLADSQSRERFADYIRQHFELQSSDKQLLELETVGNEVEGKYFWVYQEMNIPELSVIRVKHTSLQEVWPSQINYLNVERAGEVSSLRINADQEWYELTLPSAADSSNISQ